MRPTVALGRRCQRVSHGQTFQGVLGTHGEELVSNPRHRRAGQNTRTPSMPGVNSSPNTYRPKEINHRTHGTSWQWPPRRRTEGPRMRPRRPQGALPARG